MLNFEEAMLTGLARDGGLYVPAEIPEMTKGDIAAMAGLLYLGMIRQTSLSLANPLLLPSVAAAVIGGTSIFGGRGSFAGAIVGALIIRVLDTMLTLMPMPEGARTVLFGAVILAVTAIYVRITGSR